MSAVSWGRGQMMLVTRRLASCVVVGVAWSGFSASVEPAGAEPSASPETILAPVPLADDGGDRAEHLPAYDWRDDDYELFPSSAMACYDGCVESSRMEPASTVPGRCLRCSSCRCSHRHKTHDLFGGLTKLYCQLTDFVGRCSMQYQGCCDSCCSCCDSGCEPDCGAG